MDKFKVYLAAAIKNRFWILCVVVVLLGLGSWLAASANLRDTTKKARAEIEKSFTTAEELTKKGIKLTPTSVAIHPNAKVKEETGKIIGNLEDVVEKAWGKQYGYQGDEIFVWPEELRKTPRFLNAVQGLRPIERVPLNHEINVDFRGAYRDYIKKELPLLAEIIHANWDPGATTSGGTQGGRSGGVGGTGGVGGFGGTGGGNSDSEAEVAVDRAIVDWSKANQAYFQNVRLNWSHMPDEAPNTLQMLYAQEDLWVLQALLRIIQKTNGDADSKHNAAIRKIDSIQLGADAVASNSTITKLGGGATAGSNSNSGPGAGGAGGPGGMSPGGPGGAGPGKSSGGPGASPGVGAGGGTGVPGISGGGGPGAPSGAGGPGAAPGVGAGGAKQPGAPGSGGPSGLSGGGTGGIGPGGPGGPGGGQSSGSGAPATNANDPAEGRYVDRDYNPLPAAKLRGAATSTVPQDAYLSVAKRMPVRLSLVMDQNKLNTFLVECGNSPLTVEVRQVRFNRSSTASSSSGASKGNGTGGSTGGFGAGGAAGLNSGFGGGKGGGNSEGSSPTLNPHPWDRPIEIYGIVYIYNPVDAEKLKLKSAVATNVAAGANTYVPSGKPSGTPSGPGAQGPGGTFPGAGGPGTAGPGAAAQGGTGGAPNTGGKLRRGEESPEE